MTYLITYTSGGTRKLTGMSQADVDDLQRGLTGGARVMWFRGKDGERVVNWDHVEDIAIVPDAPQESES